MDLAHELAAAIREDAWTWPGVYCLRSGTIAKRYGGWGAVTRVFLLSAYLRLHGIPVAEPLHRIDPLELSLAGAKPAGWYLLMRRVPGTPVSSLDAEARRLVTGRYRSYLERIVDARVVPYDCHMGNVHVTEDGDLAFFDVDEWRWGSPGELRRFRSLIPALAGEHAKL